MAPLRAHTPHLPPRLPAPPGSAARSARGDPRAGPGRPGRRQDSVRKDERSFPPLPTPLDLGLSPPSAFVGIFSTLRTGRRVFQEGAWKWLGLPRNAR